jgi:hypothetical protein
MVSTAHGMDSPKQTSAEEKDSWRERFFWAFGVSAAPIFMYCYFPDGASSFVDSVIAASVLGTVFGILAALFGKRILDFLLAFPW